jgi:hypothetical protein
MYKTPFTDAGEELTMGSLLVAPVHSGLQIVPPLQPLISYATICPVFLPAYTTPFATAGADSIVATSPVLVPFHNGWHDD